jgi:hypothetical protein
MFSKVEASITGKRKRVCIRSGGITFLAKRNNVDFKPFNFLVQPNENYRANQ